MSSWDQPSPGRRRPPLVAAVALVVAVAAGWVVADTPTASRPGAAPDQLGIERVTGAGDGEFRLPEVGRRTASPSPPSRPSPSWDPPARSSWSVLPPAPVGSRTSHVVADVDGAVVVWGGYRDGRPLRDGAVFDPDTGTWRPTRDAPAAEDGHLPVEAGDALLLLDEQQPMAYERVLDRWRRLPPPPLDEGLVLSRATAWTGRVAVVLTTEPGGAAGPALAYDPTRDAWTRLPSPPVAITNDHALAWNARDLLLFGRSPEGANAFAHRLTFGTTNRPPGPGASWEPVAAPPLDDAAVRTGVVRAAPSGSVRAGDPVYVWVDPRPGVTGGARLLAYRDSPDAAGGDERWTSLGAATLREPVSDLVWTGRRVLAMGPCGAVTYGPAEREFTPLPDPGVPLGQRRGAAWTGTLVVWWGGVTGDGAAWRPAEER
jgi:hypothetical protein